MRSIRPLLALLAILELSCSKEREVTLPERSLGEATTRFSEPFTHISGIRELSDGRLIVADPGEKKVLLLDRDWTGSQPVGRQGQGPTEYSFPAAVLPYPGDSTLVHDLFQNRLLLFDPAGVPVRTIALPQSLGFGLELKADGQGNVYLRPNPLPGPGRMDGGAPDSAAVVKWNVASNTIDTVGRVRLPTLEGGGNEGGFVFMIQPMSAADDWAAAPEGWVGMVRVEPFSVAWSTSDGREIRGAELGYQPIPLTEADKTEWERARRENAGTRAISMSDGGGDGAISEGPPPEAGPPPDMPELKWPTHKPPFLEGAVMAGPGQRLWVLRTRSAGDAIPRYDVVDSTGTLVERVTLTEGSRIIGFGPSTIYVARTDEDGLEWLERYRQ
jgi:hypothetical protein